MTPTATITGRWVHAHEQDRGDARVFVAAEEPLPPSRGRRRLNLRPDGSFDEDQPGPDDRAKASAGFYDFDGQELTLRYGDAARGAMVWAASLSGAPRRLTITRKG